MSTDSGHNPLIFNETGVATWTHPGGFAVIPVTPERGCTCTDWWDSGRRLC